MEDQPDNFDATTPNSNPIPEPTAPENPTEGGIFSGEDTRVETENLPEVPEVVQQAPMSSITPALRTESTVTGDLKLGGNPKKKKWPLFVALGAVAVVLLGVAGWMLLGSSKNKGGAESEAKAAFNQFGNYYLYGTDSTDAIQGDYNKDTIYKAVVAMEERDIGFFNKAKSYYDAFIQAYEQDIRATQQVSDAENINDYLNGNVVNFTQMFDFIYRFAVTPALTSEDIFGIFTNTDFESTQQFISDYYTDLSNTVYELGSRYAKERTVYDLAQNDRYYMYRDSNCLNGEDLAENCKVDTKKYDMSRIEEAAKIADSDILQLPDEVIEDSIGQLYLIQKEGI